MPEPTVFLSRHFPPVSIIRPTATKGAVATSDEVSDDMISAPKIVKMANNPHCTQNSLPGS